MQKLHDDQIPATQENIALILSRYDITDFSYNLINAGLENTSLAVESGGKKYVLRVYRQGKKTEEDISFELDFQDYLRGRGIPIPRIYKDILDNELAIVEIERGVWRAILMEFAEGTSDSRNYTSQIIKQLAPLQAKMHLLGIEYAQKVEYRKKPWPELFDGLADRIDVASLSTETANFVERVKKFRYALPPQLPYGYNHLDLDIEGNVLVKDDHVNAIIDFDDLAYSPVVVCLGYTLWAVLFGSGEQALHEYLKEYTKIRTLTKDEMEALPNVMLFRNYVVGIVELLMGGKIKDPEKVLLLENEIPRLSLN